MTNKTGEKDKRWYCLRRHKELSNEESKECRGCESLSLTILKELPYD